MNINYYYFLEIMNDQELETWMKTKNFPIKSSSTSVKFMIRALPEEIKPVVVEKKDFQYREL